MSDLVSIIRKHVLKNAFDYGKASAGAVVGKVIAEAPDSKKDMKATMAAINAEISRVSSLGKADIENEMAGFEYAEKKEEKKGIEIPGAEQGKVVVRYPPEPNGWPHIGHAKAFCLSWSIAKRYGGKIMLRWDDTNPEAEKAEFLEAIRSGIKWLQIDYDQEKYCSDYIPQMYELCQKLISQGDAYSCSCKQEDVSKGREAMERCSCANKPTDSHLAGWRGMLEGAVPEGGATIRLKGDMASQNTVMRDPTLFRILTTPHYRQGTKYRVWPTYDFQGAVMDSILGITQPIRSKEYELRDELYAYLLKKLGLRVPQMISISRLSIKNAPVSKRLLRPLVESGKLWGWDDPRLPTLAGLNRRGIMPQAIRDFVLSFGISKVESEPDWEALLAENRKLLDPISPHYFFVADPVEVKVHGLEHQEMELKLHPKQDMGMRPVAVSSTLYIPKADAVSLKTGDIFRLKDLCNVQIEAIEPSGRIVGKHVTDSPVPKKIQWVASEKLPCTVLVPGDLLDEKGEFNPGSLKAVEGICEGACVNLKPGDIVQFERFGFCRLDKAEGGKPTFIFSC
ncbi:glutamate--tRNA ligase [Candidatus Micrarchaeota archaeon]|nr:glutamate--tRNA ligase [Candidatus Micrarchaeota archaeon]